MSKEVWLPVKKYSEDENLKTVGWFFDPKVILRSLDTQQKKAQKSETNQVENQLKKWSNSDKTRLSYKNSFLESSSKHFTKKMVSFNVSNNPPKIYEIKEIKDEEDAGIVAVSLRSTQNSSLLHLRDLYSADRRSRDLTQFTNWKLHHKLPLKGNSLKRNTNQLKINENVSFDYCLYAPNIESIKDLTGMLSEARVQEDGRSTFSPQLVVISNNFEVGSRIKIKICKVNKKTNLLYLAINKHTSLPSCNLIHSKSSTEKKKRRHLSKDWIFSDELALLMEDDILILNFECYGRICYRINKSFPTALFQLTDNSSRVLALCLGMGVEHIQIIGLNLDKFQSKAVL